MRSRPAGGLVVEQLPGYGYALGVGAYQYGDVAGRVTAPLQFFDRFDDRRSRRFFFRRIVCRDPDVSGLRSAVLLLL